MRVLVLTPFLCVPPEHGGRIRSFHLLRALAGNHTLVNLTRLDAHDDLASGGMLEQLGVEVEAIPGGRRAASGGRRRLGKLLNAARGRSHLLAAYDQPALRAAILRRLEEDWDLVCLDQPWLGTLLPEHLPAPLVYASNNVESAVMQQRADLERGALARRFARREAHLVAELEARLLERSALTVAVSREDAERFQELCPRGRVAVVENGTDLEAHPLLWAPEFVPLRLLFVGGCDYPPNLDAAQRLVRDVLPLLRDRFPDSEIQLAGRDPEGGLAAFADTPGVRLLGHVPSLSPVYARSSALAVPMTFGGGSRLKILEAWAFGRPVIASAVGASGLDAVAGDHYLLAETPGEFVDAVERLRSERDLAQHLVASGRKRVEERHSWTTLGKRFEELLEESAGHAP